VTDDIENLTKNALKTMEHQEKDKKSHIKPLELESIKEDSIELPKRN